MRLSDTYKLDDRRVLTGIFRNTRDLYHAQEVLTDFGYPKEAAKVVKLKDQTERIKIYSQQFIAKAQDKAILGISLAGVLILGAVLAGASFYTTLNISEVALLITIWTALLLISAVVCGLIGAVIAALIGSVLMEENVNNHKDTVEKGNVLISVAARTQNDARDIAREWEEIGGEVVGRS